MTDVEVGAKVHAMDNESGLWGPASIWDIDKASKKALVNFDASDKNQWSDLGDKNAEVVSFLSSLDDESLMRVNTEMGVQDPQFYSPLEGQETSILLINWFDHQRQLSQALLTRLNDINKSREETELRKMLEKLAWDFLKMWSKKEFVRLPIPARRCFPSSGLSFTSACKLLKGDRIYFKIKDTLVSSAVRSNDSYLACINTTDGNTVQYEGLIHPDEWCMDSTDADINLEIPKKKIKRKRTEQFRDLDSDGKRLVCALPQPMSQQWPPLHSLQSSLSPPVTTPTSTPWPMISFHSQTSSPSLPVRRPSSSSSPVPLPSPSMNYQLSLPRSSSCASISPLPFHSLPLPFSPLSSASPSKQSTCHSPLYSMTTPLSSSRMSEVQEVLKQMLEGLIDVMGVNFPSVSSLPVTAHGSLFPTLTLSVVVNASPMSTVVCSSSSPLVDISHSDLSSSSCLLATSSPALASSPPISVSLFSPNVSSSHALASCPPIYVSSFSSNVSSSSAHASSLPNDVSSSPSSISSSSALASSLPICDSSFSSNVPSSSALASSLSNDVSSDASNGSSSSALASSLSIYDSSFPSNVSAHASSLPNNVASISPNAPSSSVLASSLPVYDSSFSSNVSSSSAHASSLPNNVSSISPSVPSSSALASSLPIYDSSFSCNMPFSSPFASLSSVRSLPAVTTWPLLESIQPFASPTSFLSDLTPSWSVSAETLSWPSSDLSLPVPSSSAPYPSSPLLPGSSMPRPLTSKPISSNMETVPSSSMFVANSSLSSETALSDPLFWTLRAADIPKVLTDQSVREAVNNRVNKDAVAEAKSIGMESRRKFAKNLYKTVLTLKDTYKTNVNGMIKTNKPVQIKPMNRQKVDFILETVFQSFPSENFKKDRKDCIDAMNEVNRYIWGQRLREINLPPMS